MGSSPVVCERCKADNRPNAKFCSKCGKQLPRYILHHQVGQGGFSVVYEAEDRMYNRPVAIKEMNPSRLSQHERNEAILAFNNEARLLARLTHPNLPRIYEHFEKVGRWYLVMDFIEGETLEKYLENVKDGKIPFEEGLVIGTQLCTVLDYLHTQQPPIIFRDLKPLNIMRTPRGHIYLIDFGIARLFKPGQAKDTRSIGSPGYAPIEQYGKAQTSPRSDIYSLGAILHQLLSGKDPSEHPFQFTPLRSLVPSTPTELDTLIMQMLEMDMNKRPASMADVKQSLEDIISQLVSSAPVVAKGSPAASPQPAQPPPSMPICSLCGTPNPAGTAFCANCGQSLLTTPIQVQNPVQQPPFIAQPPQVSPPVVPKPLQVPQQPNTYKEPLFSQPTDSVQPVSPRPHPTLWQRITEILTGESKSEKVVFDTLRAFRKANIDLYIAKREGESDQEIGILRNRRNVLFDNMLRDIDIQQFYKDWWESFTAHNAIPENKDSKEDARKQLEIVFLGQINRIDGEKGTKVSGHEKQSAEYAALEGVYLGYYELITAEPKEQQKSLENLTRAVERARRLENTPVPSDTSEKENFDRTLEAYKALVDPWIRATGSTENQQQQLNAAVLELAYLQARVASQYLELPELPSLLNPEDDPQQQMRFILDTTVEYWEKLMTGKSIKEEEINNALNLAETLKVIQAKSELYALLQSHNVENIPFIMRQILYTLPAELGNEAIQPPIATPVLTEEHRERLVVIGNTLDQAVVNGKIIQDSSISQQVIQAIEYIDSQDSCPIELWYDPYIWQAKIDLISNPANLPQFLEILRERIKIKLEASRRY